jgi:hypothetical protein
MRHSIWPQQSELVMHGWFWSWQRQLPPTHTLDPQQSSWVTQGAGRSPGTSGGGRQQVR